MNAEIVYQVAKVLPNVELERLLVLLQQDITSKYSPSQIKKARLNPITDEGAIKYLLKNIFNCNQ